MKYFLAIILLFVAACASRPAPMLEYSLAKTALAYSKALARPTDPDDSQKLTAMVLRSQEYYDQAEKFFDKENYEEAEKYFRLSRILSEKAENFFHIKYPGANQ